MMKTPGNPWPNRDWRRVTLLPQRKPKRVLFPFQRRAKAAAASAAGTPTLTEEDLREVLQRLSPLP